MSIDDDPPAIACRLSATEYRDRISWIAELNRAALRGSGRAGRGITLIYDASAADRVREFVRRERDCCPFLEFVVRRGPDTVTVTVEPRADVDAGGDELFAPYLTGRRT